MNEAIAVIDCGTNSTRVLVRGADGVDLARRTTITRLGRDVDAAGRLDPEAIGRTLAAVEDHVERARALGASRFRVLCTSAVRDAANAEDVLGPLSRIVGVEAEVVEGPTEAELSFAGAVGALRPSAELNLVVDIGGGSTELAVGRAEVAGAVSLDVGSVRLTERFIAHDPPLPEELSALLSVVDVHLDDAVREVPDIAQATRLIGVAGTVTTVAAVEIGLVEWDRDRIHGFVLTRAAVEDVFRTLATESLEDRIHNPGLEPARADVIVAGTAILAKIMRRFGFDECVVSDADLLDGAAAGLVTS